MDCTENAIEDGARPELRNEPPNAHSRPNHLGEGSEAFRLFNTLLTMTYLSIRTDESLHDRGIDASKEVKGRIDGGHPRLHGHPASDGHFPIVHGLGR